MRCENSEISCWQGFAHCPTVKIISIQISEVGVRGVVIVVGNKRIIRFGMPVTYDTNSTANRVLDEKELFAICKQVKFLFGKFQTRIEYEAW